MHRHALVGLQCEETVAALHAPPAANARVAENGSATGRLGNAMQQENNRHIDNEQEQQQLLMR